MGSVAGWSDDEERSVIADKGEITFIDHQQDQSLISYNPSDDGPIVVSVPFPFMNGQPQSVTVGETASDSITIKNNTDEPIELWTINIYSSSPEDSFKLSLMEPPKSKAGEDTARGFRETTCLEERTVQPGQELTVWVFSKPERIGKHTTAVHFDVGSRVIERLIFLMADDKISRALASNKPYSKEPKKKHFDLNDNNYVRGRRPAPAKLKGMRGKGSKKFKLPQFPIPGEVREILERRQLPDSIRGGLAAENYVDFFTALLNLEELQLEEDVKAFNMERVSMRRKGSQFVTLEVPGLAERRPSLVAGDSIFAKRASDDPNDGNKVHEGVVHRVEADEVYLKFSEEFHGYHWDEHRYNIQFTYNRLNMRRMYWAVNEATNLEKAVLFPTANHNKRQIRTTPFVPITCVLNDEQNFAVKMILRCRGGSPYVIHGPPGTGKTIIIAEAILQLYKGRGDAQILVCTPSNSAADHILEKLLKEKAVEVNEEEVFRLNASSRPYEDIHPDLLPFCYYDELEGVFKCPPLRFLKRCRIVITTYMSASNLLAEGVERGQFSHLFLDEAGQASEPETMIPISSLCRRDTVVVLAGDPMQLGPIVYSKKAECHGLGKSYLERLFESEPYSSGDKNYVTKLVRNYRCRPEILHLPSTLFYEGELIACRDESSYLESPTDFLQNNDFPILFIGIQGCDEREGNNPSWFNRIEASKVVEVIDKLRESGKLTQEDIGIITPYRQQVLKLRKALEIMEMLDIKIGSVEQFQGQERQVIVVSTVRSTVRHNEFDLIHCLGFLSNPRRFNVAMTRAISLLIVVGNPHIICKDPYWNQLLWYCVENDAYQGCALPEKTELAIPEPVQSMNPKDDAHAPFQDGNSRGSENCGFQGGDEYDWGQYCAQTALPVPCTNEDEWSDGWK
ncbi:probable RNA helicase SDE3 [Punica granatum]|nr:probable RNA helicase SDE3 [Punica granatum]XP_031396707.1 probable RNA helicase SDE3 [Punica granatum]XP_031396708.1 probable RNA helicase SDE3 [Punica granatum]XP_031396709.1 probable RNA helicase SDE3 [Punica granatum]OWM74299.1 hypothetical protein CDL15_Pgr008613 [Punica granatum]